MLMSLPTKHIIEKYAINKKFKNCNIYYWNFLPLINFKYFNHKKVFSKNKNYKFIYNYKSIFNLYKNLPDNFYYINFIGNYFITSFIETLFRFKNGKKISIDFGTFIDIKFRSSTISILSKLIKKFGILFTFKKAFFFIVGFSSKIFNTVIFQNHPNFFFVSSEFAKRKLKFAASTNKIFKIDSEDMRKFKKTKVKKNQKIITFLDQGFDDNFDYSLRKYKITKFSPETYWKKMNNFFRLVEEIFPNHKVVIACHPRRNKNSIKKITKKRNITNKTLELVAQSKFVIAHYSQSINFAVLLKKPLLLIDSNDFKAHTLMRSVSVKTFANLLGSKIINLENKNRNKIILNEKNYLNINHSKYEKFKNFYIGFKDKKNNRETWKSIIKSI